MKPIRFSGHARQQMKITYDSEVDALYFQFLDATVTTEHLAEGITADYDAEVLDVLKQFQNPQVLRQIILEDIALIKA